MFPHVVELSQRIEKSVASLIWFEIFDDGAIAAGKPLFALFALDSFYRVGTALAGFKNREVSIARLYAVADGE